MIKPYFQDSLQTYTALNKRTDALNAFGMVMPERSFSNEKYKYGFNGKETDRETQWQDYGFRIYYPSLCKFVSVDPLSKNFPWNSTYAFAENDVIRSIDMEGLEKIYYHKAQGGKYIGLKLAIKLLNKAGIMQDLQKSFALANLKTDIHIIVDKLKKTSVNESYRGNTVLYGKQTDNSKEGKQIDLKDMRDDHNTISLKPIISSTLKEDKKVIIVTIDESDIVDAATNKEKLKEVAFTIAHEIKFHAIKMKNMEYNSTAGEDHAEGYNDSTLKNHNNSPSYQDINPDSDAGRMKSKIEKAADEN
jgi:RHS repeat-associated protein